MPVGDKLAGRYVLEAEVVSQGGMGTVFRAWDLDEERPVAVKLLTMFRDAGRERFAREIEMLAQVEHPNIVRYQDRGTTSDGVPFLVMEWIEGDTLARLLVVRGVSMAESILIIERACDAVAAAHKRGIVHRDIKPANLMFVRGDLNQLRIVNFGLARPVTVETKLTETGVLLGTPGYMAPEQASGHQEIDVRADVFALGCVLYECLTGYPAFSGESLLALRSKILLSNAVPLKRFRPDASDGLADLVARMLDKDPSRRPSDAAAVSQELSALETLRSDQAARGLTSPASREEAKRTVRVMLQPATQVVSAAPRSSRANGVIMATRPLGSDRSPAPKTDTTRVTDRRLSDLARPFGGHVQQLPDGDLVVHVTGEVGEPLAMVAARTARCALALRPSLIGVQVSASVADTPLETLIEDVARLLMSARREAAFEAADRAGILLDPTTAILLHGAFDVRTLGASSYLGGE